jgi:hypothetical protein
MEFDQKLVSFTSQKGTFERDRSSPTGSLAAVLTELLLLPVATVEELTCNFKVLI